MVKAALAGEEPDAAKLAEAERWLHRNVELVRGKYKGRLAAVVGMTAKKYRVRVDGVEHQLEFYPSMFKHPMPIPGAGVCNLQAVTQETATQASPRATLDAPSAMQALNTTQQGVKAEGEKSCSDSTGDPSEETATTERIPSKTR